MDYRQKTDAPVLESPQDAVLQEDLEQLLQDGMVPFELLKNKTVFVTGATGLLGSQIIKALLCSNRVLGTNTRIFALVRSEQKAGQVFGGLLSRGDLQLVYGDVSKVPECAHDIDYVIHGESATSSRYFVTNPVETSLTAVNGTANTTKNRHRSRAAACFIPMEKFKSKAESANFPSVSAVITPRVPVRIAVSTFISRGIFTAYAHSRITSCMTVLLIL